MMDAPFPFAPIFLEPLLCANQKRMYNNIRKPCGNKTTSACGQCNLVEYCSLDCQTAHWRHHKGFCEWFSNEAYEPRWRIEQRNPEFIRSLPQQDRLGPPPCLWGNLPAIDLLNVNKNEGSEAISRQNVSLLFEASGDLRNVVKTIVGLPENYSGECKVAVNDANTTVIARNALLLLVTLFFRPEEAAPVMLHLWYSAMLPKSLTHGVRQRILPLVQRVCHRIKENPDNWMEEEVVEYGKASVCLVLKKSQWIALVAMLVPSENFTRLHGQAILRAVAEAKQDHIDRLLYKMPRARRAGAIHFRHSGVLLPFGASCVIFSEPNLTLFAEGSWPLEYDADPLNGWSYNEYSKFATIAKDDAYGALYFYLRDVLFSFCKRVRSFVIRFEVLSLDVVGLKYKLKTKFDRIEVSNISDRSWIDMRTALITFPLILKVRSQNPSATLLLLFINDDANDNNSNTRFDMEMVLKRERMVKKYLSEMKLPLLDAALSRAEPGSIVDLADPEVVLLRDAIDTIGTWDDFKSRFKQLLEPAMGSERPALKKMLGSTLPGGTMRFKDYHTIVPPWPHLASKQMTREGLEAIMAGARCGSARYVEIGWKA